MDLLNVFTNESGKFGTPLGIVEDLDNKISENERLKITKESGFTEFVFIESLQSPTVSIYTPEESLPFASHALVGTHYYLVNKHNILSNSITSKRNKINVFNKDGLYWADADISILPKFKMKEFSNISLIDSFNLKNTSNFKHMLVWSWIDEKEGTIRARTFAPDWGILEDEANGSGSMLLAHKLKRSIKVFHGSGSVIHAYPTQKNHVSVGGLIKQKF